MWCAVLIATGEARDADADGDARERLADVVEGVCVRVAVDETVRVAVEEADNAEREPVCEPDARDAEGVGEPAVRVRVHVADCDCASALRG